MTVIAIALTSLALAGDFEPSARLGALVFASYRYDLTTEGSNEFGLDRAYVTASGTMTERLGAKITLDMDRIKYDDGIEAVDTKYRMYIKNAWLEWGGPFEGAKLRAGVVDTGYAPYYDNFTGLRYVAKSMADEHKYLDTADVGVNLQAVQLGGLVDWHVALLNGEGYGKPEVDGGKAGQARFTLDPLAKGGTMRLPLTGFVSYAGSTPGGDPTLTWAGAVGWEMPHVLAWGEVLGVQEGPTSARGYSATLIPRIPDVVSLVGRYDHLDVDVSAAGDEVDTLVAGVARDFAKKVSLAATYEQTTEGDEVSRGAFLHLQAGF